MWPITKKKKKEIEENPITHRQKLALIYNGGFQMTYRKSVTLYDYYRRISGPVLFMVGLILVLFTNYKILGTSLLLVSHLHVFLNQIWWKIMGIEEELRREKEAQDPGCEKDIE